MDFSFENMSESFLSSSSFEDDFGLVEDCADEDDDSVSLFVEFCEELEL